MGRFWYAYNGIGDPLLASSYNAATVRPGCANGPNVCAIYAVGAATPATPLSTNIKNYIANIQLTLIASPDSSLALKKYVYGKTI